MTDFYNHPVPKGRLAIYSLLAIGAVAAFGIYTGKSVVLFLALGIGTMLYLFGLILNWVAVKIKPELRNAVRPGACETSSKINEQ